jgi:hypothetical protein
MKSLNFATRQLEYQLVEGAQCLVKVQNEMSNLYIGPSIDASYQVSYHLVKRFQRKSCFRNRPIRIINKYGRHRQVLFLIGQFLKQLFL